MLARACLIHLLREASQSRAETHVYGSIAQPSSRPGHSISNQLPVAVEAGLADRADQERSLRHEALLQKQAIDFFEVRLLLVLQQRFFGLVSARSVRKALPKGVTVVQRTHVSNMTNSSYLSSRCSTTEASGESTTIGSVTRKRSV